MTDFKTFVEEVRSRSDIVAVIGADMELRPAGATLKALSPFHSESNPSFVVWPSSQSWHDFSNGGGLGGDVFNYVQERDKVGFKEAVFILAERAGVRRPNQDDESWKRELDLMVERRAVEQLLTKAAAYYHRLLPIKIREDWYHRHYGFTDETVNDLQLGWADGNLFEHLTHQLGVSREMALKTGLFIVLQRGHVHDLFTRRLVFPYWRAGQVVYFIARRTDDTGNEEWEKAKYKKLLTHSKGYDYVSPTVRNDYFYNEGAARDAEELLITEGITDCISARQAGISCISPATTSFRNQDVPRLLQLTNHARRIIICNDSEVNNAGEAGAQKTAAALWGEGRDVRVSLIPRPEGQEKIDVNELVVKSGPEALRQVLAAAKPYPEYLLDRIPKETPKINLDGLLVPVLETLVGRTPIITDTVVDALVAKFDVHRRGLLKQIKDLSSKKKVKAVAARKSTANVPEIRVGDRQLRDIVMDARAAVVKANEQRVKVAAVAPFENDAAPLFVRCTSLVRLERQSGGSPMLTDLTETAIFGVLAREADWVQETEEGNRAIFPPKDVSRDLLTYPPPDIPAIESVITTPVFGSEGHLLATPGLHAQDRLWLESDPMLNVGEIPERPTPDQIVAAKALFFDDLFVDFPFATQSDRAHALAAVLLVFVRRMIDGCTPIHVVEAPAVGAGKGLLCNLVSIVVTGESCDSRTLPETDEEIRKMLTAELSKARPIIMLDNANERLTLTAPPLASVLTTTSWTDRVLGRTLMLTVPNKAMWMLTGNNPKLSKDIARRSVRIRIDPKVDRAWMRTGFKHDPVLTWAKDNRNDLVHAALVLVRAWLAAGRPLSDERLGSFENWAAVMGGILGVAGVDGFLGNLEELYANADTEGEAWREFVLAWWDEHGEAVVHVADLTELCDRQDLMLQVRGDGSARSQQSRLGRALQSARDRVFGDIQVVVMNQDRKGRTLYALNRVVQPAGQVGDPEV